MYDVVAAFDRGIEGFPEFFLFPTELPTDEVPRVVEAEQSTSDVNAPLAAQIAEVDAANHLVGDEQRVGVDQETNDFIERKRQALKLALDLFIFLGNKIPTSKTCLLYTSDAADE